MFARALLDRALGDISDIHRLEDLVSRGAALLKPPRDEQFVTRILHRAMTLLEASSGLKPGSSSASSAPETYTASSSSPTTAEAAPAAVEIRDSVLATSVFRLYLSAARRVGFEALDAISLHGRSLKDFVRRSVGTLDLMQALRAIEALPVEHQEKVPILSELGARISQELSLEHISGAVKIGG